MNGSIFWPCFGIIPTVVVNRLMCIGYISHHNVPVKMPFDVVSRGLKKFQNCRDCSKG
jgi:hypothetical protein